MSTHIHVWLSNNQCSHCPTTKDRYILQLEQDLAALQQRAEVAERERDYLKVFLKEHYPSDHFELVQERDTLRADLARCREALKHYIAAGNKFIGKIRNGRARSVETYNDLLECHSIATDALSPSALSAGEEWARMQEIVKTAQWIVKRTPRPPTAITYDVGVDLVNLVQKELCPVVDALSPNPTPTTPGPVEEAK